MEGQKIHKHVCPACEREWSCGNGGNCQALQPMMCQACFETPMKDCWACEEYGKPIRSSVSDKFVHPSTNVGRVVCIAQRT